VSFFEEKLGLRQIRRGLPPPGAVSLKPLRKFAAPNSIMDVPAIYGAAIRAQSWFVLAGFNISVERFPLASVPGRLQRREISGKRGFTKMADAYAGRQYGATLQASFCHR